MSESRTAKIGFFALVSLGLNTIIGSSIFRVPAELARDLGPFSVFIYFVGALVLLPVALSFAEATSMFGESGGSYVHARAAFGERAGNAVGFSMWAATVLTLATSAVAMAEMIGAMVPPAAGATRFVAAGVVCLFWIANIRSESGGWVSALFLVAKVAPLLLLGAVGLLSSTHPVAAPIASGSVGASLLVVFYSLSGFESCAIPSGDSASATKRVPLAVGLAIGLTTLLYAAIQLAVVHVPGASESKEPLASVAAFHFGPVAGRAVSVLALVSMGGLAAAMIYNAPLLLLPGRLQRPRALLLSALATLVLTSTLNFRNLVDFTSVTLGVQYIATCASVARLRKTMPLRERPVRLPLGATIPLLGILTTLWVVAHANLREIALGAAVLIVSQLIPNAAPPRLTPTP